jgi:hypothetical protein
MQDMDDWSGKSVGAMTQAGQMSGFGDIWRI